MKTILHQRKAVTIGLFGLLVLLVAGAIIVNHMDREPYWTNLRTPVILGPDKAVGETRSAMDFISLTLDKKQYSFRNLKIAGTLKNTGDKGLIRDEFLSLQILQNGVWYSLERSSYIATADIKRIEPGETMKVGVWLELYGETLMPGRYRAVFSVSKVGEKGKPYYLSEEFDVVE